MVQQLPVRWMPSRISLIFFVMLLIRQVCSTVFDLLPLQLDFCLKSTSTYQFSFVFSFSEVNACRG